MLVHWRGDLGAIESMQMTMKMRQNEERWIEIIGKTSNEFKSQIVSIDRLRRRLAKMKIQSEKRREESVRAMNEDITEEVLRLRCSIIALDHLDVFTVNQLEE